MAKQPPRKFTLLQLRRRLKAVRLQMTAIGSAYQVEHAELRNRILLLRDAVQEMLDRFPNSQ